MSKDLEQNMTQRRRRSFFAAVLGTAAVAAAIVITSLATPMPTLAFSPAPTVATEAQVQGAAVACGWEASAISLELHGNAGVAIISTEESFGYCLVIIDGDKVLSGPLYGTAGNPRPSSALGLFVAGGTANVGSQAITVIVGLAPQNATRVDIEGVEGAYANVVDGHFGIWLDDDSVVNFNSIVLVARDAAGVELERDDPTAP